jgi:hypothetical protein
MYRSGEHRLVLSRPPGVVSSGIVPAQRHKSTPTNTRRQRPTSSQSRSGAGGRGFESRHPDQISPPSRPDQRAGSQRCLDRQLRLAVELRGDIHGGDGSAVSLRLARAWAVPSMESCPPHRCRGSGPVDARAPRSPASADDGSREEPERGSTSSWREWAVTRTRGRCTCHARGRSRSDGSGPVTRSSRSGARAARWS